MDTQAAARKAGAPPVSFHVRSKAGRALMEFVLAVVIVLVGAAARFAMQRAEKEDQQRKELTEDRLAAARRTYIASGGR